MNKNNSNNENSNLNDVRRTSSVSRVIELYIWMFLAFLIVVPSAFRFHSYRYQFDAMGGKNDLAFSEFILDNYYIFLVAALLFIFPILFKQIFGMLPLELIRNRRNEKNEIRVENIAENSPVTIVMNEPGAEKKAEQEYILECVTESKQIAEKIYQRSGAYLFIGSLIALFGVAIFYSPIFPQTTTPSNDISIRLIEYLPRFGALFFIEFIAFFFLRQYRIMLEEFRYYEGIKRFRQDNFSLIKIIEKYSDKPEVLKSIVDKFSHSFATNKLSKDETTEMLETKKIINQEQDFFNKFTELIKEIKNK